MNTGGEGFDWSKIGPTDAQCQLARSMLHDQASFPEIRRVLAGDGMKAEFIEKVITDNAAQLIQPLVISNSSRTLILQRLTERGLTEEEALGIVQFANGKFKKHLRQGGILKTLATSLAILGCVAVGLGGFLWVGNVSGLFPTSPGAGALLVNAGLVSAAAATAIYRFLP